MGGIYCCNLFKKKMKKRLITTESVSFGHPDKMADQISDAILDAYLKYDVDSKVAVETMVKDNIVVVGGEISSNITIDYDEVIRETIKSIGFKEKELIPENIKIINLIGKQSIEINKAVVSDDDIKAGDQGFMVGFATQETPTLMPLGMFIAKDLIKYVSSLGDFGPDMKSQVTIEYGDTVKITDILISTMHRDLELSETRKVISEGISSNKMGLPSNIFKMISDDTRILVNPAGSWLIGGPISDCGVTGRKIVVDQYGPYCTVGGGAFSGKDFSKIDRSGAYLARYIAKNIVRADIAYSCKVEIAYIIGLTDPSAINIELYDVYGNKTVVSDEFINFIKDIFPVQPKQISDMFELRRPIYRELSRNGHFGIEDDYRLWEKTDKSYVIKEYFKNEPISISKYQPDSYQTT